MRAGLDQWTLRNLCSINKYASRAEESAQSDGLLQRIDHRVKLAGFLALIVSVIWSRSLPVIAAVFTFSAALSIGSKLKVSEFLRSFWPVFLFTGCIAL